MEQNDPCQMFLELPLKSTFFILGIGLFASRDFSKNPFLDTFFPDYFRFILISQKSQTSRNCLTVSHFQFM